MAKRIQNPVLAQVMEIAKQDQADRIAEAKGHVKDRMELAQQGAKVAGLLAMAGVPATFDLEKAAYPMFDVPVDKLKDARRVFGKFEHYSTDVYDATHVRVKLRILAYPRCKLVYLRDIPVGSKCRIVETENTYKTKSLVCA